MLSDFSVKYDVRLLLPTVLSKVRRLILAILNDTFQLLFNE